jgi:hypothetical protein
MRILPVLLIYLIVIGILYIAATVLSATWMVNLLYHYRLILMGIGVFLSIFAAGEIYNIRRK